MYFIQKMFGLTIGWSIFQIIIIIIILISVTFANDHYYDNDKHIVYILW